MTRRLAADALDVQSAIADYQPTDTAEATHQRRMLALLPQASRAFDRHCYLPGHFTASAFVLSPRQTELLLILHSKLNLWLQPGGHMEPDDTSLEQAARREVLEETGLGQLVPLLCGPLDLDIHAIPSRPGEPAHEHFDVRYLFSSPSQHLQAASDALDARWIPLQEVRHLATDESVMRAVRKITTWLKHTPDDPSTCS